MRIRFETKPGKSLTWAGVFPSSPASATTAWTVASEVSGPRTTSTRAMTGTGLKKCMPTTWSGRAVTAASEAIGIEDVLDARTAPFGSTSSARRKTSSLTAASSTTASTIRSASARSSTDRRRGGPPSGWDSFPFPASRSRLFRMAASPRSAAPGAESCKRTRRPEAAKTCAMPAPIWPAPTTRTRSKLTARSLATDRRAEELEDADALALLGVHAQQLVELRADDEDRGRREHVRGEDEEDREAPDRGLEVGDGRDVEAEEERGDDPARDHEHRSRARPLRLRALGRRVTEEQADGKPEQRHAHDPAADADDDVERSVRELRGRQHGQRGTDQPDADDPGEPDPNEEAAAPRAPFLDVVNPIQRRHHRPDRPDQVPEEERRREGDQPGRAARENLFDRVVDALVDRTGEATLERRRDRLPPDILVAQGAEEAEAEERQGDERDEPAERDRRCVGEEVALAEFLGDEPRELPHSGQPRLGRAAVGHGSLLPPQAAFRPGRSAADEGVRHGAGAPPPRPSCRHSPEAA